MCSTWFLSLEVVGTRGKPQDRIDSNRPDVFFHFSVINRVKKWTWELTTWLSCIDFTFWAYFSVELKVHPDYVQMGWSLPILSAKLIRSRTKIYWNQRSLSNKLELCIDSMRRRRLVDPQHWKSKKCIAFKCDVQITIDRALDLLFCLNRTEDDALWLMHIC